MKMIVVSDELHKRLSLEKVKKGYKSFDNLIEHNLNENDKKNIDKT